MIDLFKTTLILGIVSVMATLSVAEEYSVEDILLKSKNGSDDIVLAQIEYDMGQQDVVMARSEALPQINFNTGIGYAGVSRASEAYISRAQQVPGDTSMWGRLNRSMAEVSHIHGTTVNWGASISQPLITFGQVSSALKIAKVSDITYTSVHDYKKEMSYLNVFLHFNNAYVAHEEVNIYKQSLVHAQKFHEKTVVSFELGNALVRDTLMSYSTMYQIKSMIIKSEALYKVALRELEKLTDVPLDPENTVLKFDESGWFSSLTPIDNAPENLELTIKESEVEMRRLQINYERGKLFPSIYLNGSLDNSYMIPNFKRIDKDLKDEGFKMPKGSDYSKLMKGTDAPSMGDYFNPDYFNYSIGVQLTWNIFDGRRSIANYRKARLQYKKSDREYKKLVKATDVSVEENEQVYIAVDEALKALLIRKEALEIAFSSLTDDVNDGFADYLTFLDMEKSLAEVYKQISLLQMQKGLTVAQYKVVTGKSLIKE